MGKFVMKTNEKGSRFVLKAGNGEIIGISETYSSETACKNGVESVRKNAVAAGLEDQTVEGSSCKNPKFEVYKDKAGEFRFRLKAANGEIILTGESYKAKAGCLKGIESIRKNAAESPVVEESLKELKASKGTAMPFLCVLHFFFAAFSFQEKRKSRPKRKA